MSQSTEPITLQARRRHQRYEQTHGDKGADECHGVRDTLGRIIHPNRRAEGNRNREQRDRGQTIRYAHSIHFICSEANVYAQPKNDGSVAGAQARINDLEIGCDMKPGCYFRLVINLHALFGALEADQVRDHAILQFD